VAVAALLVAVCEGWIARRHDRLSVRPLFEVERQIDTEASKLVLRNVGLGPAIIKTFKLWVDGFPAADWQEAGEKLGISFYFEHASFHKDHAIPQAGFAYLMTLHGNSDSVTNRVALEAAIHRLRVQVNYVSMYGERMPTLTWSGSPQAEGDRLVVA
jgi:hypothetical protein